MLIVLIYIKRPKQFLEAGAGFPAEPSPRPFQGSLKTPGETRRKGFLLTLLGSAKTQNRDWIFIVVFYVLDGSVLFVQRKVKLPSPGRQGTDHTLTTLGRFSGCLRQDEFPKAQFQLYLVISTDWELQQETPASLQKAQLCRSPGLLAQGSCQSSRLLTNDNYTFLWVTLR